ncbi:hypothetical protein CRUP_030249, partial [Coryphaenoides rupestris]
MLVYILSGSCRRNAYGYVYCSPPVLSHGFFLTWCLNMLMIVAAVFLFLICGTNFIMISLSCRGLHMYGAWLSKYHCTDLWLHRVQNGLALYATWTTIATLINLAIVLQYDAKMLPDNAAMVTLSTLTCVLFAWCVLENFIFEKHVRYILTVYPVVIWALSGSVWKNIDATAPRQSGIFMVITMGEQCPGRLACILVSVVFFVISLLFNGLAVVGMNSYGYVYCSPAVLPYGFFISWCINMGFNIGWLIVWDRGSMLIALIFLILVILTNYAMIAFSCHGLHLYGAWLNKYHKVDLWCVRILVQNGLGLYTTWTTIATLINLSIVLTTDALMAP